PISISISISNPKSPILNLQSSISNLQSPIFNLQSSISNLQSSISNLQSPIFNLTSPITNLQPPTRNPQLLPLFHHLQLFQIRFCSKHPIIYNGFSFFYPIQNTNGFTPF